jgi:hypothetical protein
MNLPKWLRSLFKGRDLRFYVVISDGQINRFREDRYSAPYDTDPRRQGLPVFKLPLSDAEFERDYRQRVRAFPNLEDAFEFVGHCNLDNLRMLVFDRVNSDWVFNSEETGNVLEQLD